MPEFVEIFRLEVNPDWLQFVTAFSCVMKHEIEIN